MKLSSISTLSLLSALVLSACGGGGGAGGGNPPSKAAPVNHTLTEPKAAPLSQQPQGENTEAQKTKANQLKAPKPQADHPETQKPQADNPETKKPEPEQPKTVIEGRYFSATRHNPGSFDWDTRKEDNLNYLNTGFERIPLIEVNVVAKDGWYNVGIERAGIVSSPEQLTYTRHGIIQPVGKSDVYIFAQGEKATNMPISRAYTYAGKATFVGVHQDKKDKRDVLGYEHLPVYFIADFDKKELLGGIDLEKSYLPLTAKINGDKFESDFFANTQVKGQFYGPEASELGGVYYGRGKKDYSGTFGAKKTGEYKTPAPTPEPAQSSE